MGFQVGQNDTPTPKVVLDTPPSQHGLKLSNSQRTAGAIAEKERVLLPFFVELAFLHTIWDQNNARHTLFQ
jgi:hypothetical protein